MPRVRRRRTPAGKLVVNALFGLGIAIVISLSLLALQSLLGLGQGDLLFELPMAWMLMIGATFAVRPRWKAWSARRIVFGSSALAGFVAMGLLIYASGFQPPT
jgi:hypothetical protein